MLLFSLRSLSLAIFLASVPPTHRGWGWHSRKEIKVQYYKNKKEEARRTPAHFHCWDSVPSALGRQYPVRPMSTLQVSKDRIYCVMRAYNRALCAGLEPQFVRPALRCANSIVSPLSFPCRKNPALRAGISFFWPTQDVLRFQIQCSSCLLNVQNTALTLHRHHLQCKPSLFFGKFAACPTVAQFSITPPISWCPESKLNRLRFPDCLLVRMKSTLHSLPFWKVSEA